ncbi:MAG: Uma2 family endonuclease [Betaproteobacteria bacterium]|nr:Uma2 family endonuclease [Betaproteobacteria bacterium]
MGQTAEALHFSPEEYLAWESEQPGKNEYVAGEVFAMGGASRGHVTVALNVASALSELLAGGPCRVYMSDMKLEVAAAQAYFYPDVFVTCDADDHRAAQVMRAPTLIVEVLSPSTAAFDRGGKFQAYRHLSGLREYVLIDPEARSIELFRHDADGRWTLEDIAPDAALPLPSLGVDIPWVRVFRNVD